MSAIIWLGLMLQLGTWVSSQHHKHQESYIWKFNFNFIELISFSYLHKGYEAIIRLNNL